MAFAIPKCGFYYLFRSLNVAFGYQNVAFAVLKALFINKLRSSKTRNKISIIKRQQKKVQYQNVAFKNLFFSNEKKKGHKVTPNATFKDRMDIFWFSLNNTRMWHLKSNHIPIFKSFRNSIPKCHI